MPSEILEVSAAASATSYTINKIAAATDLFIRAEAVVPSGNISEQTHARTIGGPRADLGTSALREVHGFAPNVLQIVLANGVGATWQDGTWAVKRRDGSAINVVSKWRHSIPVSADDFTPTASNPHVYNINSDNVTATDHRIYLVLDQPIGSTEMLQITGPAGINFRLPFSDRYLETPVVQLNQVGYNPRASKRWAYVSGWMGDGGGLSLANFPGTAEMLKENDDVRELVQGGLTLAERAKADSDAGTDVENIDISNVPTAEGVNYRIRIPGVGVSWRTQISEGAAFQAFYVVMRGLFFNRWSGDLRANLTNWSRPQDHAFKDITTSNSNNDPATMFCNKAELPNGDWVYIDCPVPAFDLPTTVDPATGALLTNDRQITGGYHDAGDYDQRPMHTVVPQVLMRAYELNPSLYKDGQLNIPESGNKIPDILDEALWGISAWEQLQESDGGVRMGFDTYKNPDYAHADLDVQPYWTFTEQANISARAAGLFAQASRLVASFDNVRASKLSDEAVKAYTYAKAKGASNYFLLYPAGELYKLTKTDSYRSDFESFWVKVQPTSHYNFPNFADSQLSMSDYVSKDPAIINIDPSGLMPDYLQAYYSSGGSFSTYGQLFGATDPDLATRTIPSVMNSFIKQVVADKYVDDTINSNNPATANHAHRNPRRNSDSPDWGLSTSVGRYLDSVIAVLQMGILTSATDKQAYFDSLSLAADYILGGNPNGFVYITGLGSRHPMEPLHMDSLIFTKEGKGPMPGIPTYGPVENIDINTTYLQATMKAFYPDFNTLPLLLRYGDTRPFVTCNEFSVWEMQGPLAELFSILLGPNMMP